MTEQHRNSKIKSRSRRGGHGRFSNAILDEILGDYQKPEDLIGERGVLGDLISALVSRAMDAELTHHLGYEASDRPPELQSDRRNGKTVKGVRTGHGPISVEVPRDRDGTFEPQIIGKHERHFNGFDDQILAMYARGMSVRDIQSHLSEIYRVDVSSELISRVTDGIVDELRAWQMRPLEAVYPIVYIDALVTKIRDKGSVQNKSVYIVVGVAPDGHKDVLGLWIEKNEGAKRPSRN